MFLYLSHGLVLAAGLPVKDCDLQGSVEVAVAERDHGDLHRLPGGIQGIVDLDTLPHHRVAAILVQAII